MARQPRLGRPRCCASARRSPPPRSERDICRAVADGLYDEALGYDFLALLLVDEATGERELVARAGRSDAAVGLRITPGRGLSERPLLDGRLHYTPHVTQRHALPADPEPGLGGGRAAARQRPAGRRAGRRERPDRRVPGTRTSRSSRRRRSRPGSRSGGRGSWPRRRRGRRRRRRCAPRWPTSRRASSCRASCRRSWTGPSRSSR